MPTKVEQMTTPSASERVAVVTGASAGIGEATARTLAGQGFHVVCVARREGPIKALADEIGGTAIVADVTDDKAVSALASALDRVDVLVNNAGGARGLEPVMEADLDHWRWMWESNVLGTLRVTRAHHRRHGLCRAGTGRRHRAGAEGWPRIHDRDQLPEQPARGRCGQ